VAANANQTGLPNDAIRRAIMAWFVAQKRTAELPTGFAASGAADLGGAAAAAIRVIERASGLAVDSGIAGPDVLRVLTPFLPSGQKSATVSARGRLAPPPFAKLARPRIVGQRAPSYIVLHLTEASDNDDALTIEAMASSMAQGAFGAHALVSKDGRIGQTCGLNDMTQHVSKHNSECIGIEQLCSSEDVSRADWLGARVKQVWATAWWVAWVGQQCGIPLVQAADDRRVFLKPSGVCEHRHVPDNDHDDCGKGYPLDVVLQLAQEFQTQGIPARIRDALPGTTVRWGPKQAVIASTFDDHLGYHGDDLTRGPLAFAELSTNFAAPQAQLDFKALGGLAYQTQVRITTAAGKQAVAEKLDIGAGGPHHPVIDLHARTAAALGLPADFLGQVTLEIEHPG
jgi:hypothetical protein